MSLCLGISSYPCFRTLGFLRELFRTFLSYFALTDIQEFHNLMWANNSPIPPSGHLIIYFCAIEGTRTHTSLRHLILSQAWLPITTQSHPFNYIFCNPPCQRTQIQINVLLIDCIYNIQISYIEIQRKIVKIC